MANYIKRSILFGRPLKLFSLVGGYKQAALSNFPFPDWAELFNLAFLYKIGHQLKSNYAHGIKIIYRSDEVVMTELGNYKLSDLKTYNKRFEQIINYVNKKCCGTGLEFHLEYTKRSSKPNDLFPLISEIFPSCKKEFDNLPKETQEKKIAVSLRNQCWNGKRDLTTLCLADKIAWSRMCAIRHEAFLRADLKLSGEYLKNGISISYRRGVPDAIHYRSCSSSSVQPWAGEGCLVFKEGIYHPWILSKEQLIKTDIKTINISSIAPLSIRSLQLIKCANYTNEI